MKIMTWGSEGVTIGETVFKTYLKIVLLRTNRPGKFLFLWRLPDIDFFVHSVAIRATLCNNIATYCFTELPDKQKLFWILICEELDILNSLGRFLQQTLP
jgi:hypothetical protein